MASTVTRLADISPEPRRAVRDSETLAGYLERAEPAAASRKTTARALAHYRAELAADLAIAEIYLAGWDACAVALGFPSPATPHLRLADVTAASVTVIRQASR